MLVATVSLTGEHAPPACNKITISETALCFLIKLKTVNKAKSEILLRIWS
jgi:hypothetical protein